jgi:hypothetical protein
VTKPMDLNDTETSTTASTAAAAAAAAAAEERAEESGGPERFEVNRRINGAGRVDDDGTTLSYVAHSAHGPAVFAADRPLRRNVEPFLYFEVSIESLGERGFIAVGICVEDEHIPDAKLPGWL